MITRVFVPLVDTERRGDRLHSRLFFTTLFPDVVAAVAVDACGFFSRSPRVLSIRESFPFLGDWGSSPVATDRSRCFGVLKTRGSISWSSPEGEGDRPRVVLRRVRLVGVDGNNNF